jgi:hypothetical protein
MINSINKKYEPVACIWPFGWKKALNMTDSLCNEYQLNSTNDMHQNSTIKLLLPLQDMTLFPSTQFNINNVAKLSYFSK